ncbi:MAG: VOC family protein [Arcticibacter sp.]
MQSSIYPCIWFDNKAEEAVKLYCEAFSDTSMEMCSPLLCRFRIKDKPFMALNGGPVYRPNPSISFFVICSSEEEINRAWEKLMEGGHSLMQLDSYPWSDKYGWVQDRYGVSWQLSLGKEGDEKPDVFPSLMFVGEQNGNAERAINFYTSLFPNSSIGLISRYEKGEHDTEGHIKYSQYFLNGYRMGAMESSFNHDFSFDAGVSFVITCETQEEIDFYWLNLTEGGTEEDCGWCRDAFGVSWQVVPSVLNTLMKDPATAARVTEAFMKMKKFDIAGVERAAAQD